MKLSLEWLNDYTNFNGTLEEFVEGMTMSGSKVESFEIEGQNLSHIVTGLVTDCVKHPDADNLSVCQVDVGDKNLQIVCGAPNVAKDQKVIVALPGASLGPEFKIKKVNLRGIESNGMICSIDELGFTVHDFPEATEDGIYVLPEETPVGIDALEYLGIGQTIIEFEITSNRPDCLSVEGLARESAVTFNGEFKPINNKPEKFSDIKTEDISSISIEDTDLCPNFIGRVITDVKIEQSPFWMQQRLRAAGMRPINNIVDITNFVMLALGQPMHAYDLDFLNDNSIIVRRAKEDEPMTLLDGTDIKMNSDNLVIADSQKPVGLAGVMGAENSEVRDTTKSILFEAANFDPMSVRRTAKEYNLRSEASLRFEKGLPLENSLRAMDLACYLVELLDCGKVAKTKIVVGKTETDKTTIEYNLDHLNKISGLNLDAKEVNQILNSLEIKTKPTDDPNTFIATAPFFRNDLSLEADLSEEVTRIYGYNRVKGEFSKDNSVTLGARTDRQLDIENIHSVLNGSGAYEVYTYTFVSPNNTRKLNLPEEHVLKQELTILNPLSEEYSKMRTSVLPSLLKVVEYNLAHGNSEGLIYELGKTFHPRNVMPFTEINVSKRDLVLPDERVHLSLVKFSSQIQDKADGYYLIKGMIEELFEILRIPEFKIIRTNDNYPYLHPGQSGLIYLPDYDYEIGYIGTIHPSLKKNFEISDFVYVADLDLDLILNANREDFSYKPLPKFPAIMRDLAFVMPETILVDNIKNEIANLAGQYLEQIEIFDVYQGKGIPEGMKSVAFSLTFRSADRTLKDQDITSSIENIISSLAKKDIELRK
ncbi:MAG: phenylalanine--tRNA ligase subunit beta [Clostridiaceae bacterium]|nr:phenylalanine--tRNA ligase subunit beta [Clostridiaceae bacterium]